MNFLPFILAFLTAISSVDVAPMPMLAKGIVPSKPCEIRMESEVVVADLYHDRSVVDCTFEMMNYGEDTTIEVGFPVMDFHHWDYSEYSETDKSEFKIIVDGKQLTANEIKVPQEIEGVYNAYMKSYAANREHSRKEDSIFAIHNIKKRKNGGYIFPKGSDSKKLHDVIMSNYRYYSPRDFYDGEPSREFRNKVREGKYPWYVWQVHFKANEKRTIKVSYELASGMSYGANYRYFKYILHTGAGWYKDIGQADIILKLHNIGFSKIDSISPGHTIDRKKKEVKWSLKNLEPTVKDDIYLQYFSPSERKAFEKKYGKRRMASPR